jgi:hypothetical protein
MTTLI